VLSYLRNLHSKFKQGNVVENDPGCRPGCHGSGELTGIGARLFVPSVTGLSNESLSVHLELQADCMASPVLGGLEDELPANDEIRKIVSSVDTLMRQKYPNSFSAIEPVSYKTQVVAGMNYFVRVSRLQAEVEPLETLHTLSASS
jgi:hypothetical protein